VLLNDYPCRRPPDGLRRERNTRVRSPIVTMPVMAAGPAGALPPAATMVYTGDGYPEGTSYLNITGSFNVTR
jgi:hypothetical protein